MRSSTVARGRVAPDRRRARDDHAQRAADPRSEFRPGFFIAGPAQRQTTSLRDRDEYRVALDVFSMLS